MLVSYITNTYAVNSARGAVKSQMKHSLLEKGPNPSVSILTYLVQRFECAATLQLRSCGVNDRMVNGRQAFYTQKWTSN